MNIKRSLSVCMVVAIFGCAGIAALGKDSNRQPVVPPDGVAAMKSDSALNYKYGIWIGKGPKILSTDGKPLLDAKVSSSDDAEFRYLDLDEDARLVVNRYLACGSGRSCFSGNVNVTCPGYCSRSSVPLYNGYGVVDEIRLEKADGQSPCREFDSSTYVYDFSKATTCGFDLVEGDWLPPRGWGRVEDVRVKFFIDADSEEGNSIFVLSPKGIRANNSVGSHHSKVARIEFLNSGDGYGDDYRAFSDCTNRVLVIGEYFRRPPVGFKVRGRNGRIENFRMECRRGYRSGSKVKKVGAPECLLVRLVGRVDEVVGKSSPRSPVFHPVSSQNVLAFGVSNDGRSAVCFGWTRDGAVVPEIFEKGVYTLDLASDLPGLETLYFDPSDRRPEAGLQINGLPELRTVVVVCDSYRLNFGPLAFADNPKLDTVVFREGCGEMILAANTFDGCSKDIVAVYPECVNEFAGEWKTCSVSNLFTRMCTVQVVRTNPGDSGCSSIAVPEIDVGSGTVELPVLRRSENCLEKEYSDGRIQRFNCDGSTEKLRK